MNPQEMVRVQAYLRKVFGTKTLSVRARPKIKDSAEVYVGDDFVGTLTLDNEDGELCYQFQMAILELDLEDVIEALADRQLDESRPGRSGADGSPTSAIHLAGD